MELRAFTAKEIETASLLAAGHRRIDVARNLGVSINTVKARVDSLLYKSHARNTAHMVHVLTKRGVLVLAFVMGVAGGLDDDKHRRHTRRRLRPAAVWMAS